MPRYRIRCRRVIGLPSVLLARSAFGAAKTWVSRARWALLCPTDALMFSCADGLRSAVLEGFGIASPPCLIPSYAGKRDLFLKTSSGAWALCEGMRVLLSFHQRVSGLSGRLSFTSQRRTLTFWCLFYKSPALLSVSSATVPTNVLHNSELRPRLPRRFYRCQLSSLCNCKHIPLTKRWWPVTQLLLPPQSSLHILQVLAQTVFLDKPPI